MDESIKALALAGLLPFLPPRLQKRCIDSIIKESKLDYNLDDLQQYEKYFQSLEKIHKQRMIEMEKQYG